MTSKAAKKSVSIERENETSVVCSLNARILGENEAVCGNVPPPIRIGKVRNENSNGSPEAEEIVPDNKDPVFRFTATDGSVV
jgi:hypothetical protein